MLGILALALGCAACTDSPVLAEPAPEAELLALLRCTADVRTLQMTCTDVAPLTGGVSPALFGTSQVKLASSNVAHDSATGIFGMDVTAQNLLSYAIGTPDGTTLAGLKIFFETGPTATYHTPGDTGTVRVHNPSGYQNITAAQQPFFLYDTILHPQEVTAPKRWEFSVPSTVKSFGFTVRVFTATQQENRVPMRAPEGSPAWFHEESRSVPCKDLFVGDCLPNVVSILFHESSTQEERQSAVDHIKGTVRGGRNGFYHVEIPTDTTLTQLREAIRHLRTLPQVRRARPFYTSPFTGQYLTPYDGTDWRSWRLNRDSADGKNWALEQIAAPYGWGCSVGDTTTTVAVIDDGFQSLSDLQKQVSSAGSFGYPTGGNYRYDHGTRVAAIVAGYGNDTSQVAGVMWRARLIVRNAAVNSSGTRFTSKPGVNPDELWGHVRAAGEAGARVINLSVGWEWGFNPDTVSDPDAMISNRGAVTAWFDDFKVAMDSLAAQDIRPLIVFSAGNESNVDARWNIARIAADSADQFGVPYNVLVVGASTQGQQLASFSSPGTLVRIAAPGENVTVLHGNGRIASSDSSRTGMFTIATGNGTSFAAPHVAGAAGLLFSFDPRLSAADVKDLILKGARRGDRNAGTVPILNVRESLILAGRTADAPLCGNRIWTHGGFAYAQRDTVEGATPDQLFQLPPNTYASYLDALHGGKAVEIAGNPRRMMRWSETGWTAGPVPPVSYPYYQPGANGTTLSGEGRSHSLDTLFTMTAETVGNGTTYRFRLTTPTRTVQLPGVGVTRPYAGGANVCISRFDSISTSSARHIDTVPGLRESYAAWREQVGTADECVTFGNPAQIRYSEARAAYAPEGRYAYVFFSERAGSTVTGDYSKCRIHKQLSYEDPDGKLTVHHLYVFGDCRPATTLTEAGAPAIYRVNLSTGAADLHTWTTAPIAAGFLVYPALREDGQEVILQLRQRTRREEYTWTNVSANEQRMQYGSQTLADTCRHQFRDFRTGTVLLEPPATCSEAIGISADRRAH